MKIFCSIFTAICFSLTAEVQAANVAGIKLEDNIQVDSKDLVLNGAGVREKFIFDIYVIGLYLPDQQSDSGKLLASPPNSRVLMHFVYKKVEKEKLDSAWQDGFEDNLSGAQLESLTGRLEKLKSMFGDAVENDVVLLDYIPGRGTRVTINDSEKGWIAGEDFNSALLSVWLGGKPIDQDLKNKLLGK